jgi:hypothetical protein
MKKLFTTLNVLALSILAFGQRSLLPQFAEINRTVDITAALAQANQNRVASCGDVMYFFDKRSSGLNIIWETLPGDAMAQRIPYSGEGFVDGVYQLMISEGYFEDPEVSNVGIPITVAVHSVNPDGTPGAVLGSESFLFDDDYANLFGGIFVFTNPVAVSGDYFISITNNSPTLDIYFITNAQGEGAGDGLAYDFYNGVWDNILDAYNLNRDWYIIPLTTHTITADFEVEDGCVNDAIQFTNTSIIDTTGYHSIAADLNIDTYTWDFGDGSATSNLKNPTHTYAAAGTYSVELTLTYVAAFDSTLCEDVFIFDVEIFALPTITASSNSATNEFCPNGTAILNGAGGVSYVWNNGVTNNTAFNLAAPATYEVVGTDANGCSNSTTIDLTFFELPTIVGSPYNATGCGATDGGITTVVTGGATPYGYLWNNNSINSDLTNVPAGNYTLTLTDGNSCVSTYSGIVGEDGAAVIALAVTQAIACNGETGEITLTSADDISAYSFVWTPSPVSANVENTVIEVLAGPYAVTGTGNGCTVNGNISISQPTAIVATAVGTDISCHGLTDGMVTVTATGGTSTLVITPAQTGLAAGPHTFVVVDGNGCTVSTNTITIAEPAALTISAVGTDITCFGEADGEATVTTGGGTGAITVTPTQTGLTAGTYTFVAEDANGCTASSSTVTIAEPTAITGSADVSNSTDDTTPNGSIDLTVGGGAGGYSFIWVNTANTSVSIGTTEDLTGLDEGSYAVLVTDDNGCDEVFGPFVIASTASIADASSNLFNLFPNPSTGIVNVIGDNIETIKVVDVLGKVVYVYDAPISGAITMDLSALATGTYVVIIATNEATSVNKIQLKK